MAWPQASLGFPETPQDSPRLSVTRFRRSYEITKSDMGRRVLYLKCGFTLSHPCNYESWTVRGTRKHLESEVRVLPL